MHIEKISSSSVESKSDINIDLSKPLNIFIEISNRVLYNYDNILHIKTRRYNWNAAAVVSGTTILLSFLTLLTLFGSSSSQLMFNSPTPLVYGLGAQFNLGAFNHTGLELNTKAFLDGLQKKGDPPIYTLSPEKARAVLSGIQASHPIPKLSAEMENRTIPGGPDGKNISITIVRPPHSSNETLPVVMYFHGGGWVLGGSDTHDRLIREIAIGAHAAIVFVNYTPSPEVRYPIPIEEAYAATKWVAQNGPTIHVNSSHLAVAGDSVGGNMATVVALLVKEHGGPPIKFQVLFYPVTDTNFETQSYLTYQNGYWLTRDAMKWFWSNYLTNQTNVNDPTVSPLHASLQQLKGLPPALVINGENDVLRDEGHAYALKLLEAGVPVTTVLYHGTIHDFVMLNAITDDPAPRAAIDQASQMLKKEL